MRLADIEDVPLILDIMRHEDVAPFIGIEPDADRLMESMGANHFFLVDDGGYVHVEPMSDSESMLHAAALPEVRGRPMIYAGRAVIELAFMCGIRRVNAWIHKDNHRAAVYANVCGLRRVADRTDYYPDNYNSNGNWYALEAV